MASGEILENSMVWDGDGDVSNTAVHTNLFMLPIQQLIKYHQVQRTSGSYDYVCVHGN